MCGEVRMRVVVKQDGEIHLSGLPYKKGEQIEMMVRPIAAGREGKAKPPLTARQLLDSGLVGMWKDREDIDDNLAYARRLRERAQRRHSEV